MWSSIEQPFGIVCACLPTLRPLARRVFPTIKTGNSNMGSNPHFRPKSIPLPELDISKSGWKPSTDPGSTVGFARLPDNYRPSAKDSQTSICHSFSAAFQISAARGAKDNSMVIVPWGILKKQEIDQRSDAV